MAADQPSSRGVSGAKMMEKLRNMGSAAQANKQQMLF